MAERAYTTKRMAIVNAIVDKLKTNLNGTGPYLTDVNNHVLNRLKFMDELEEFPFICVSAGQEVRQYQGAGFKDRFLAVNITCYVMDEEDNVNTLEQLLEDVETCLEENSKLLYTTRTGAEAYTIMITVQSIGTDEGVMAPYSIGELLCEVRY